jgi:hypothetical protein
MLEDILMMTVSVENNVQPATCETSRSHILILTCIPNVLDNAMLVGNMFENRNYCGVAVLSAKVFGVSTKFDETLQNDFDHRIQASLDRLCYLSYEQTAVGHNRCSQRIDLLEYPIEQSLDSRHIAVSKSCWGVPFCNLSKNKDITFPLTPVVLCLLSLKVW